MKTINSLSGGKTSSYLAVHYPSDYNIFSLVCIDDKKCKPNDKRLIQKINDKLDQGGYIKKYGEFIATAESDVTLKTIFQLEQKIGKNINWLRGKSFDQLINDKKMLPFKLARFCTQEMKMRAVGEWAISKMNENIIDGVPKLFLNNVGIRHDEDNRVKKTKEERSLKTKIIIGKRGSRNAWKEIEWGVVNYPLVYDKITHYQIKQFWDKNTDVEFPLDSNCVGCFHKNDQQLRKNWDNEPLKMEWFASKEREKENREWKRPFSYDQIKTLGLQQDFKFGTGSGCNAGFCTD